MQNRIDFIRTSSLKLAELCLETTRLVLGKHRYRIAGTRECHRAAREIAGHFRAGCDTVTEEAFTLYPGALWYLGKTLAMIYVVAGLFVILGGYFIYPGSFLCLIGLSYGLSQYVFYGRVFDPFFTSSDGCNVIGTLEPADTALQQVVLVGHHDSPYIFTFLERLPRLAFIRLFSGMLSYAWLCVYSLALTIRQIHMGEPQSAEGTFLWITIAGSPFVLQLFNLMSKRPSPGAGDNLNSVSMISGIAGYFQRERADGAALKHTRLILLSSDGEEIGQRGASEFVKRHHPELQAFKTCVLNIDSVYCCKDLAVLKRDRNRTCGLSKAMVRDILEVAESNGLRIKSISIPFGGGGTDAAAFAAAGIEATSIIAQPTALFSGGHVYHTSKDVVEAIDVDAVEATLKLAIGYIRKIDERRGGKQNVSR